MLCQFLLYSKVTQLYIHIHTHTHTHTHTPFLTLSSIIVYPKRLVIVPCAVQQELILNVLPSFFFFFFGGGCIHGIWKFPGWGSNGSCSCHPVPQLHRIQAVSLTYTTAHSNAGSLTHWVRTGIKPTTSWVLEGFVTAESQRGTPMPSFWLGFFFLLLSYMRCLYFGN